MEKAAAGLVPKPSHAQEAIWTVEQVVPGTTAYHQVRAYRLRGPLDVQRLAEGVNRLLELHEPLRAEFSVSEDGSLILRHRPAADQILEVVPAGESGGEEDWRSQLSRFSALPFDLSHGPLVRGRVLRLAPDDHVLALVFHHVVADAFSLAILLEQLSSYYADPDAWKRSGIRIPEYSEHAAESRAKVDSGSLDSQRAFWVDRLKKTPDVLQLQHERAHPRTLSLKGSILAHPVPQGLFAGLAEVCAKNHVTPFVLVYAVLQAVLHRYTGATDLLIAAPVRTAPGDEAWSNAVGLFLNTVVLRGDLGNDPPLPDLLASSLLTTLEALEHRDYPFAKVVEALRAQEGTERDLLQVLLSFQHRQRAPLSLPGVDVKQLLVDRGGTPTELGFYVEWGPREAVIYVEYSTDVLDEEQVRRLMVHFETLLEGVVADADRRVSELPLLPEEERQRLVVDRNRSERVVEGESVVEGIEAQARKRSEEVAVGQGEEALTYGELAAGSDAVAEALRGRGVGPGDVVGVCFRRGPGMVTALLGVWKAGAAYLPLDPDFPAERLAFMVEDSGASLVLTDGVAEEALPETSVELLGFSEAMGGGRGAAGGGGEGPGKADLAYLIYTSGSTGRPKGVEVTHGNLLNFIASMAEMPGFGESDVLLAVTTLSFDIAGLELWLPLWCGGRVELASEEEARDGVWLADRLDGAGVTVMQATPATWRMLLEAGWSGRLRKILCGGEAFPPELVGPLAERADEVWNMYGPTETTIWSTVARVSEEAGGGSVPIGRPVANTQVYVMDGHGRLTPEGIPGELWIGGEGVARGYHARPELNEERFVADPFIAGGRVYRTGDLVRWRRDGQLEHLGRMDTQVKVNGFRIELGEVEAVLGRHPDVRQAAVAVKEGTDGEARLVAYVVWREATHALASEIRRHLRTSLPDYMVPGLIVDMDALPLTPNGKVDRKQLPNPLLSIVPREYVPPRTATEVGVAGVWSELLEREQIGLNDNFFELGGHSLLAVRAAALIVKRVGVRIEPRAMFFQTLEQVAAGGSASEAGA